MAFCPDLATAGTAAWGHNSLIDNNSPPLTLSLICLCPRTLHPIHVPHSCPPASMTEKSDPFFPLQLSVFCSREQTWMSLLRCACGRLCVSIGFLLVHPQTPWGPLKPISWREDSPPRIFVFTVVTKTPGSPEDVPLSHPLQVVSESTGSA